MKMLAYFAIEIDFIRCTFTQSERRNEKWFYIAMPHSFNVQCMCCRACIYFTVKAIFNSPFNVYVQFKQNTLICDLKEIRIEL